MCGINGIINFNHKKVDKSQIHKMMQKLKHRGPDDQGIFINNNVGFGFVRLSIIDLSKAGHQPMFDKTGRFMIIHNGEVYNYIELRKKLINKGYTFISNTDTEVILYSFIEWGENCFNKFNGMWAFCIYDLKRKKIFISRDRFGIKPFYYYIDHNSMIFSSEIKPIISITDKKSLPNYQSIFDYLVYNRTDYSNKTFFKNIQKLEHGHSLTINLNNSGSVKAGEQLIKKQWYNLKEKVTESDPFLDAIEYKEMFSSAINFRLRSDVPIGVCFSGGIDSTSIVSILLKDYKMKDLNTFSAVYNKGQRGDESAYINEYRKLIKNMYSINPNSNSFINDMSNFIKIHTEPVPSTSIYAQYKVMQLAKKYVVVTLDGQGADESLAGYHYFFGYNFLEMLKNLSLMKFSNEMINYLTNHKSLYALKTLAFFILPNKVKTSIKVNQKGYLKNKFINAYRNDSLIVDNLYNANSLQESLLNHFEYKMEHLLKWEDLNSMSFSLESRVPFLDHRLVEKTLAMPSDLLIQNGTTKSILRQAMKGIVTEKIRLRQDKIGFESPEDEWFRENYFYDYILNIINSESFKDRNIINPSKARSILNKHMNKTTQASGELWKMINLELWFREFID